MSFNPDQFLNQTIDNSLSTKVKQCPPGEYQAVVKSIAVRDVVFKSGDRVGQTGYLMDVTWSIVDPKVQADLGFQPTVRQSFWLDISESGGLDYSEGKNVSLGRLRDSLKQNAPGKPWSPRMLEGQPAVVLVENRMDGDNVYADVKKVRSL